VKQFFFLSGLPRSGSTVLASILNQHPEIHVTPTSPLLDLLYLNEQNYRSNPSVIANPTHTSYESISKSIIEGTWKHVNKPIIVDKHRAWARNIPTIRRVFETDPKVILTVRSIPEIVASFFTLLRKTKQSPHYIDQILLQRNAPINDMNRAYILWHDFIANTVESALIGFKTNRANIHLVDYNDLIQCPEEELKKIYQFLALPSYQHDLNNIVNDTNDDDLAAWGIENLHQIRPVLKRTSSDAKEILGDVYHVVNSLNAEFWR
jgi:sulfotransferase